MILLSCTKARNAKSNTTTGGAPVKMEINFILHFSGDMTFIKCVTCANALLSLDILLMDFDFIVKDSFFRNRHCSCYTICILVETFVDGMSNTVQRFTNCVSTGFFEFFTVAVEFQNSFLRESIKLHKMHIHQEIQHSVVPFLDIKEWMWIEHENILSGILHMTLIDVHQYIRISWITNIFLLKALCSTFWNCIYAVNKHNGKQQTKFFKNPFKFSKDSFEKAKSGILDVPQDELEEHLRSTYSDPSRNVPMSHSPNRTNSSIWPIWTEVVFTVKILEKNQILILPRYNGIPYKVYKMSFRPMSLLDVEGKMLLRVFANRLPSYLLENGFIDISVQKAGICAGCVEQSAMIWHNPAS